MASPGGTPPPPGGASAASAAADVTHDPNSPTQDLIKLTMDAKKIAQDAPETAPMMREIENQCRMATLKLIQKRQAAQQQAPQI